MLLPLNPYRLVSLNNVPQKEKEDLQEVSNEIEELELDADEDTKVQSVPSSACYPFTRTDFAVQVQDRRLIRRPAAFRSAGAAFKFFGQDRWGCHGTRRQIEHCQG